MVLRVKRVRTPSRVQPSGGYGEVVCSSECGCKLSREVQNDPVSSLWGAWRERCDEPAARAPPPADPRLTRGHPPRRRRQGARPRPPPGGAPQPAREHGTGGRGRSCALGVRSGRHLHCSLQSPHRES
eukprot:scaffold1500_cov63-Phaeocystis_antarctica.AAC.3